MTKLPVFDLAPFASILQPDKLTPPTDDPLVIRITEQSALQLTRAPLEHIRVRYCELMWSALSSLYKHWVVILADYPVLLRPEHLYPLVCWLVRGYELPAPPAEPREWQVNPPALDYTPDQLGWYWLMWGRIVDACNILRREPPILPNIESNGRRIALRCAVNRATLIPTLNECAHAHYRAITEQLAEQPVQNAQPQAYQHALETLTQQLNQLYTEQNNYIVGVETLMLEVILC